MAVLILTGIGYSLIIAGLTLLWKRIQETILLLVMVFAIAALPVLAVPGWSPRSAGSSR